MGNNKCWANSLGDCRGKISREHVVSKGVLRVAQDMHPALKPTLVRVAWDERVTRTGLGAATVRHLCQTHNTQLSPLDDEARRFMQFVVDAIQPERVSGVLAGRRPLFEQQFDGSLLERWSLKTYLNHFAARGDGGPSDHVVRASGQHILRCVFGGSEVPHGYGVYEFVAHRERLPPGMTFSVAAVEVKRTTPTGEILRFPAYFVMNLGPLQLAVNANVTELPDVQWRKEVAQYWAAQGGSPQARYRPPIVMLRKIVPDVGLRPFARASLDWSSAIQRRQQTHGRTI
jgi:hypothetical protein